MNDEDMDLDEAMEILSRGADAPLCENPDEFYKLKRQFPSDWPSFVISESGRLASDLGLSLEETEGVVLSTAWWIDVGGVRDRLGR